MHIEAQAAKRQPFHVERALLDNEDFRIFCMSSEAVAQLQHCLKQIYSTIDKSQLSSDAKARAYSKALATFWNFAERSLPVPGEMFGSRINRCQ